MCTYKIRIPHQAGIIETCDYLLDKDIDFNHVVLIEADQSIVGKSSAIVTKKLIFGQKEFKIKKYHA